MTITAHRSRTFLFSSDDLPRRTIFGGYFFDGPNLHVRAPGARAYARLKGDVPSDLDGQYFFVRPIGQDQVMIGTDRNMAFPMFMYRTPTFWAVSNSFYRLARLAKARGENLHVVPDLMQAWRMHQGIFQRPTTYQTCLAEISVAPSYCDLIGGSSTLREVIRTRKAGTEYAEGLANFVELSRARFRTLTDAGVLTQVDLTGGIDSRVAFALAWSAMSPPKFRKLVDSGRLRVRSIANAPNDIEIASSIAHTLDVPLFTPPGLTGRIFTNTDALEGATASGDQQQPDVVELFRSWRRCYAGRLAAVRGTAGEPDQQCVNMTGSFGAVIKSFDPDEVDVDSGAEMLERFRGQFGSQVLFDCWKERVKTDVKKAATDTGSRLPFTTVQAREFAMRFHTDAHMGGLRFAPLSFGTMLDATEALAPQELRAHKAHHDVIAACDPRLFEHRYDQDDKAPRIDMPPVRLPEVRPLTPGRVHGLKVPDGREREQADTDGSIEFLLRYMMDHSLKAARDDDVRGLLGADYCDDLARRLRKMRHNPSLRLQANQRSRLHTMLFAKEIAKLTMSDP